MLQIRDLHGYYGKSHILQGVDLDVGEGEIVSLLGRNGVGRSTTIKAIMGEVEPKGSIKFKGKEIAGLKTHDIARRGIGYVPQDGSLFMTMSVREQIGFALAIRKVAADDIRVRVDKLAELLGITGLLERRPHKLSGGERQRVVLGRALTLQTACLFDALHGATAALRPVAGEGRGGRGAGRSD